MRRIGLIGSGKIVQRAHSVGYRALAGTGAAEVAALADPSEANRTTAGTLFNVPAAQQYADYREMLAKAPIDTVVIATPHSLHAEHAIAAAEAGKAVISEKPMAVTLEDADAILAAVKRHAVPYTVVHNFLYTQPVQAALAVLADGSLGALIMGRGEMLALKPDETTRSDLDWRASRAMGGGALIDSSYHEIYTVETLMGSPVKYVEARLATLRFPIDVDDTAMMTFEHENGALSQVTAAWGARAPGHRGRWVWINGTQGSLRVVYSDAVPVSVSRGRGGKWEQLSTRAAGAEGVSGSGDGPAGAEAFAQATLAIDGDDTGHGAFLRAAVAALEAGAPLPVTPAQARRNLAIIEGARRASAERRAMEVSAL